MICSLTCVDGESSAHSPKQFANQQPGKEHLSMNNSPNEYLTKGKNQINKKTMLFKLLLPSYLSILRFKQGFSYQLLSDFLYSFQIKMNTTKGGLFSNSIVLK